VPLALGPLGPALLGPVPKGPSWVPAQALAEPPWVPAQVQALVPGQAPGLVPALRRLAVRLWRVARPCART